MVLNEEFHQQQFDPRLQWLNEPSSWQLSEDPQSLVIHPEAKTDFWQRTHYGFQADNGHFLGLRVDGDFTLSTCVAFHPVHQYDQAGLMVRLDPHCWVKTSVEHELTGRPQLGVVVTSDGFSDWSLQDFVLKRQEIELRLQKKGQDIAAEFRAPETRDWRLMRLGHWHAPPESPVWAGIYACSPKGKGFRAEFRYLRLNSGGERSDPGCQS